jgi:hypothetical protein
MQHFDAREFEEVVCPTCKSPIVLYPISGEGDKWEPECRCRPERFTLPKEYIPAGNPGAGFVYVLARKRRPAGPAQAG